MTADELKQQQRDWADSWESLKQREIELKRSLMKFHRIQIGDALEFDKPWGETGRLAVTGVRLRDHADSFWSKKPVSEMPQLYVEGIIVTKQNRLHARSAKVSFYTDRAFRHIGRFEVFGSGYGPSLRNPMIPMEVADAA